MILRLLLPLIAFALQLPAYSAESNTQSAETILHLLDYVSVEYPQFVSNGHVVDQGEYAEQVEFSGQVVKLMRGLPEAAARARLIADSERLEKAIKSKEDPQQVVALAQSLQHDLIAGYKVAIAPKAVPDLSTAASLYATTCAMCHGAQGDGNGPQGAALDPKPTNFQDNHRQSERSVFGLYNTITLGVEGTAMRAFTELSAEDRWRLAFYISQLKDNDNARTRGADAWKRGEAQALFPDLTSLVTLTPSQAAKSGENGAAVLAYLRAHPEALGAQDESPISHSLAILKRSLEAYRNGKTEDAYQLAVTAYLEGFELAEAGLDNRDHDLRLKAEAAMMTYRNEVKANATIDKVQASHDAAAGLLREAQDRLYGPTEASPTATFVSSLIIILREGLEAILVLAAMAAFLVRTGRRDGLPWLHGGWVVALALGGLTWLISTKLVAISGAHREVTEGVTALISAGLLLYVGFWLHSRASATRWNQFIRDRMTSALSRGALAWIALVSFLAVYREVFETVLFYQALWVQSGATAQNGVIWGVIVGALVLVIVAYLFARYSVKLPLGLFFSISSILLAVMAVVFAGQGIAALQEAGKLASSPLNVPSIPLLGIYPNIQGIALQVTLVVVIVVGYLYLRAERRA